MSETPVNWETSSTNVFTDTRARDSGVTNQHWLKAMRNVGLENIVLQENDKWHDEVDGDPVSYEFTFTLGQFGVLIVKAACYSAWIDSQHEIHADHAKGLGQAFIECVLNPRTFKHVRDTEAH